MLDGSILYFNRESEAYKETLKELTQEVQRLAEACLSARGGLTRQLVMQLSKLCSAPNMALAGGAVATGTVAGTAVAAGLAGAAAAEAGVLFPAVGGMELALAGAAGAVAGGVGFASTMAASLTAPAIIALALAGAGGATVGIGGPFFQLVAAANRLTRFETTGRLIAPDWRTQLRHRCKSRSDLLERTEQALSRVDRKDLIKSLDDSIHPKGGVDVKPKFSQGLQFLRNANIEQLLAANIPVLADWVAFLMPAAPEGSELSTRGPDAMARNTAQVAGALLSAVKDCLAQGATHIAHEAIQQLLLARSGEGRLTDRVWDVLLSNARQADRPKGLVATLRQLEGVYASARLSEDSAVKALQQAVEKSIAAEQVALLDSILDSLMAGASRHDANAIDAESLAQAVVHSLHTNPQVSSLAGVWHKAVAATRKAASDAEAVKRVLQQAIAKDGIPERVVRAWQQAVIDSATSEPVAAARDLGFVASECLSLREALLATHLKKANPALLPESARKLVHDALNAELLARIPADQPAGVAA